MVEKMNGIVHTDPQNNAIEDNEIEVNSNSKGPLNTWDKYNGKKVRNKSQKGQFKGFKQEKKANKNAYERKEKTPVKSGEKKAHNLKAYFGITTDFYFWKKLIILESLMNKMNDFFELIRVLIF